MIGNWALLVENPSTTGRTLVEPLLAAGYRVHRELNVAAALSLLRAERCGLVVVDLRLPGLDGRMVARAIWQLDPATNVIFVTSKESQEQSPSSRAEALHPQLIPIAAEQLAGRAAVFRHNAKDGTPIQLRYRQHQPRRWRTLRDKPALPYHAAAATDAQSGHSVLRVGPLVINTLRHLVTVGARPVTLSSCQFKLLVYLALRSEQVVAQQDLVANVLGYHSTLDEARGLIKHHVHNIRALIEENCASPRLLITVRGVGYKLTAGG